MNFEGKDHDYDPDQYNHASIIAGSRIATERQFREEIPGIVENLVVSCSNGACFDHVGPEPIPSREAVVDIVDRVKRLLYPGYFIRAGWRSSILATISARRQRRFSNSCPNRWLWPCATTAYVTTCPVSSVRNWVRGDNKFHAGPAFAAAHAGKRRACRIPGRSCGQKLSMR